MARVLCQPTGGGQNQCDPNAGLQHAGASRKFISRSTGAKCFLRAGRPANPKPAANAPRTHTVVAGETAVGITRKYGVKLGALQTANPGVNLSRIHTGQVLNLPSP